MRIVRVSVLAAPYVMRMTFSSSRWQRCDAKRVYYSCLSTKQIDIDSLIICCFNTHNALHSAPQR